tara:strand:- start:102 stop:1211 length:1110 start_codon:yes stop_codon:yes gene_type:complete
MGKQREEWTNDDDEDEDEGEEEEEDGEEGDEEEEEGDEEEEEGEEEEEEGEEEEEEGEEEDGDEYDDAEGEAAPNFDNGSESSEELTIGKSAQQIAQERMEKRVFDKAEGEQSELMAEEAHDPEGLGEDFERTQWLPPSLKEAYLAKAEKILHHGEGSIWSTKVCHDPDLSAAACLYFQFMKTMGTAMAYMTILALPAMIFSYFGSRTPEISQDDIGLYLFTLGNVGYDKDSDSYAVDSLCTGKSPAITNGTCIHIGTYLELDAYYGANILAALEFVQVCVFLLFVYILDVKRRRLMKENENEETTIRDYSVMVTGLPEDCRPENLLAHFHNLYKLNEQDWQNRVRVAGAKPMMNLEHAQQEMCVPSSF